RSMRHTCTPRLSTALWCDTVADSASGRVSAVDVSGLVFLHGLDQALGPQVAPVRLDVVQAFLAAFLAEDDLPSRGHVDERGPQRMLALIVHEHEVLGIRVLERIRHGRFLSDSGVAGGRAGLLPGQSPFFCRNSMM